MADYSRKIPASGAQNKKEEGLAGVDDFFSSLAAGTEGPLRGNLPSRTGKLRSIPKEISASLPIKITVSYTGDGWETLCNEFGESSVLGTVQKAIESVDAKSVITSIADLVNLAPTARELEIQAISAVNGAYTSFSADLDGLEFEYINGEPRPVLDSVQLTGKSFVVLPLGRAFEKPAEVRKDLAEEALHLFSSSNPLNELVQEGVAAAGLSILIRSGKLDRAPVFTGVQLIYGFEEYGLNCGDARLNHEDKFHEVIGAAGEVVFYSLLGGNLETQTENYKRLFKATASYRAVSNSEGWLRDVDSSISGFEQKYLAHPLTRPIGRGSYIIFFSREISDPSRSPWGRIYSYNYEPNKEFGKPIAPLPNNIEPWLGDFDMCPGHATYGGQATLRFSSFGTELQTVYIDNWSIELNPRRLLEMNQKITSAAGTDMLAHFMNNFSIEILTPAGEYVLIGDKFRITPDELHDYESTQR